MKDYDVRTYREFIPSFDVAASIKMRKYEPFALWWLNDAVPSFLQCGRIHKDAEIWRPIRRKSRPRTYLQCGRIHKDAEMEKRPTASPRSSSSFNVAASIKMRKSYRVSPDNRSTHSFNVAASIKMRKLVANH